MRQRFRTVALAEKLDVDVGLAMRMGRAVPTETRHRIGGSTLVACERLNVVAARRVFLARFFGRRLRLDPLVLVYLLIVLLSSFSVLVVALLPIVVPIVVPIIAPIVAIVVPIVAPIATIAFAAAAVTPAGETFENRSRRHHRGASRPDGPIDG